MPYYGPNLVNDGLAFFLDPNNPKCYSGSGTTVTDYINGLTGTLYNGVTHTSEGFVLDGVNQHISFPHNSAYNMETGWTQSIWIKRQGPVDSGTFSKFFSKWENYFISLTSGGSATAALYSAIGTGSGHSTSGVGRDTETPLDQWVYITSAYDEASGSNELYMNMQLAHTVTGGSTAGSSNYDLNIGQPYDGHSNADQFFHGTVGHATIHNRKLTVAEMTHNFRVGAARYLS